MAPLLSITTLLLFLSLFLSFSAPSLSEKTLLSTNKNPLPTKKILQVQEEDEQPIPKPKKTQFPTKKSKQVDDQEEEEQPIPKPKKNPLPTKKSKQAADEEEEEEQPISKPKKNPLPTKKSKQVEVEELEQPISKPKKNPLPTKKPKELEEEQPISKPKKTSLPEKKSKEVVKEDEEEEEEQPIPKSKPKKIPSDSLKNQTKLLKPKKPKSNSTAAAATPKIITQSLIPKPSKIQSPAAAAGAAKKIKIQNPKQTDNPDPIWLDDPSEDEDIISEFRDLPTRIQSSLLPDLRKISITSRAYIYRANRELATRVKPFVGTSFAPRVALAGSCVLLLLLPLLLLALLFYHLNSYVSLHRFLLFVHAYLAVYFLTLSLSALAMGLEPLRFFHATSPSAYAWMQAVQTLAYVLYLLALVINLVVVFSSSGGGGGGGGETGAKTLALTQVAVGLAVGLHYYAAVFHRAVAGEPPRAGWKVHAVYAACFLVVCAFARDAERRKKAYDGGEDGKKN